MGFIYSTNRFGAAEVRNAGLGAKPRSGKNTNCCASLERDKTVKFVIHKDSYQHT